MNKSTRHIVNWDEDWNAEIGLWRQTGGGHTKPVAKCPGVHSGPNAASRLLLAAQIDQLHEIHAAQILTALRNMQALEEGHFYGNIKWYLEEEKPLDANAAFFIGLSLIVLRKCYWQKLDNDCRKILDCILKDLWRWFQPSIARRHFFYPNSYLGDLTCGWLLTEILELRDQARIIEPIMLAAADYWLKHGWGWGEHMSDCYGQVCLDELSTLLLLGNRLSAKTRHRYLKLFHELLALEDQFTGGPRVPAIRSYCFMESPGHRNFRELIHPYPERLDIKAFGNHPSLAHTFHELNWATLASPQSSPARDISVRCFGKATAIARIESDIRIGSMSHYPVMPSADHPTWGLAWQSFPVAFWRPEGDWGFLQWETQTGSDRRCHPAENVSTAYLGNALSQGLQPPIVGQTWSLQHAGHLLVLRIMPAISAAWDHACDRLRIIQNHARINVFPALNLWSQLGLEYPQRTLSVQCLVLTGNSKPELIRHADSHVDWSLTYRREDLTERRHLVTLWGFSLKGPVANAPQLTPAEHLPPVPRTDEERSWNLSWKWPGREWNILIDPLAPVPLQEL